VLFSHETLLQEPLIPEPWLFATATTTPAAEMMPTSTLAHLPVQDGTTARQQLFADPLSTAIAMATTATATATTTTNATTTTTPTMAYNNHNSDNNKNNEGSQGVANTTTGPAPPPFSTSREVVAAPAQTMTDAHPQEQQQDGGGKMAHANDHTGVDPALQVYLDRMQYLEERVAILRENNFSLLGRIVSIEKQTYW
jgi:hypothetical protein